MALGDLVKGDIRIVRLRLGYAVYAAVNERLGRLFEADTADSGASFEDVVNGISRQCLEEFPIGKIDEPETYLNRLQINLGTLIANLRSDPANRALAAVVEEMSAALRVHSPMECAEGLNTLAEKGWKWFRDMIRLWGGDLANARFKELERIGPADLEPRVGNAKYTYCAYESHRIRLLAGEDPSGLTVFFDLPFFFLHEYVSHAFPLWQDRRRLLQEAYLLRAAYLYVNQRLEAEDRARRRFIGRNFHALRSQNDPHLASQYRKAEDTFEELHSALNDSWITHLLEWSTVKPTTEEDEAERNRVLSALHKLARKPDLLREIFRTRSDGKRDFYAIHERVRSLAWNLLSNERDKGVILQ